MRLRRLSRRLLCTADFPAPQTMALGISRDSESVLFCCGRSPVVIPGSINLKERIRVRKSAVLRG